MENISNKIEEKRSIFKYVVSYFEEIATENGWTLWLSDHVDSSVWWPLNDEVLFTATKEGDCQRLNILSLSIRDDIDRDDLLNRYKERLLELGIIRKEQVPKEETMEDFVGCIVKILNYQLNDGFEVIAEQKKDDIYDISLIAERNEMGVCWCNKRLLGMINSSDRFDLGQTRIIAKLKKRIAELDQNALPYEFSDAEKEYLEHDEKEVKNFIWHIHVFSAMEEYLNDEYELSIEYDSGADCGSDPVYNVYLCSEKTGTRWLTSIEEGAYTIGNFDKVITKIKNAVSFKYPEALKNVWPFDVASMYPEHLFKTEEEVAMEEILKFVVNELNKEIVEESGYYVYYRYLYDSIKADIYLAKKLNNAPSKLVAEVYEGDVLFNSKDWLIERLEAEIDNLAPGALNENDKYLRKLIRKVRKGLKEEEEMPTSMHEFQFSSIAVVNSIPKVKRVTFSGPATIVFFEDGTKTVAKCHDPEKFDKWAGIAICICKKYYGKNFKKFFKEWDGDKELRRLERKEKKARKKMKNVKTHDDIFRENDKTMEELWIKEEGEDV